MFTSYHTHSNWSDGKASMGEMVAAAAAAGLAEYGVSDHFVLLPDARPVDWSMNVDRLSEYVAEVHRVAATAQLPVRLGLEVDFFPDVKERLLRRISFHSFDYLIGSIHFADDFPIDSAASDWEPLSQEQVNDVHRRYWGLVLELAESRLFDFIGHIDLPKKFAFYPTIDLSREITAALDAIAENDLAVELNTAGWEKPCAEAYPSEEILRACRARNIPVLINDDCHHPSHVGRHFSRAAELLRSVGYQEVVRFAGRKRSVWPLK